MKGGNTAFCEGVESGEGTDDCCEEDNDVIEVERGGGGLEFFLGGGMGFSFVSEMGFVSNEDWLGEEMEVNDVTLGRGVMAVLVRRGEETEETRTPCGDIALAHISRIYQEN